MKTREFTPIEKGRLDYKISRLYGIEINGKDYQPLREKDGVKIYKVMSASYMDKLREEYNILLKNYEDHRWDANRKTLYINGGDEGEFYITVFVKDLVEQLGWEKAADESEG
jgi:hypothetical protein